MKKISIVIAAVLLMMIVSNKCNAQWKLTRNKIVTGSLIVVGGASKGFNETLLFHWERFDKKFPGANDLWWNPAVSWKNKYENGDPNQGAAFPGSTTVLVAFTDQYHLNNFINRGAIISSMVIKIGERQKFKYYLIDFAFYSLCYYAGFAGTYYAFKK